jgi:hypothetical protein
MTETAHIAPPPSRQDPFQISFTIARAPHTLTGDYVDCHVARGYDVDGETKWEIDGIGSFEGADLAPPVAGQELIPYLVHHVLQIRDWLMEEHAARFLTGTAERISASVGVAQLPGVIHED